MPPKPAAKETPKPAAKPADAPKGKKPAEAPAAAPAAKGGKAPAAKQAPAAAPAKKQVAPAPAAKQAAAPKEAGSKKDTAGVFIKGINAGDDIEAIKKVFKSAGNIVAARRRADKFCILWFDSQGAAKKAIESFHNKQVHGTKVSVVPAKAAPPRDRADYCKTIFISNVSPNTTRVQLRAALSGYGEIIKIRSYRTGFAFVYFKDNKSAVKARNELNGKRLLNRFVDVKLSIRTKEREAQKQKSSLKRTRLWSERRKWVLKVA
jgi:RNA recognition motif-containing protein